MAKKSSNLGRGRSKEARQILKAVEAAGGTIERTGQGHLKIKGPKGVAFVASDPGSNSMRRTLRTIRDQAGLDVKI